METLSIRAPFAGTMEKRNYDATYRILLHHGYWLHFPSMTRMD